MMISPLEMTDGSTQLKESKAMMVVDSKAPNKPSSAWYLNPVAQDIHNAFILGWSLVDLRGRVQLAVLDDKKLPLVAKEYGKVDSLNTADPVQLVKGTNERLLRASRMRTVFNSIGKLQRARFPTSITIGTLYNPPEREALPYLYPPDPDYANIGINPLGQDEKGNVIWADFRLFEITRRAINCLTLLLVDPHESLTPELVAGHQSRLVRAVLKVAEEQGKVIDEKVANGSKAHSLATIAVRACDAYDAKRDTLARTKHGKAIATISLLTIRLLQAWDGYLRERFTAEGMGANNLLPLLAYEAGRNMASISWNTSVNTILLENQAAGDENANLKENVYKAWKDAFTDSNVVQVLHQITALSAVFDDIYYQGRDKPPALTNDNPSDDLLVRPDPALPSQVLQAVKQSVEYWRRTVLWLDMPAGSEEAVQAAPKNVLSVDDLRRLRQALIEQSGIWFNLMTGQQDLRSFTVESLTHQLLDQASSSLRDLAQRDLPGAAQQAAAQVGGVVEVAVGFVADISQDVTKAAKVEIERVFNAVHPVLWVVIALSAVMVVGLLVYVLVTDQFELLAGILMSLITSLLGLFGIKQGNDTKRKSQSDIEVEANSQKEAKTGAMQQQKDILESAVAGVGSGLAGLVGNALGRSGDFLITAYENGLLRIQIELQFLNFSVAVAYPLVEFFVRHRNITEVRCDLDFVTEIIWTKESREAQLRNVVTAAFGPISILLKSQSGEDEEASGGQPPTSG